MMIESKKKEYLDDGDLGAIGEGDAHLQQDPESVPNVIPIELLEALGAVPALKQKGLAHGGLGQPLLELAGLAGEHDGREGLQGLDDRPELIRVRVVRELAGLLGLPRVRGPV
jgi:hypothetical protein